MIIWIQVLKSNKIIEIEMVRDRQANLVSAWLAPEFTYVGEKLDKYRAILFFSNASKLPVYDVHFDLVVMQGGVKKSLDDDFLEFEKRRKVIPPDNPKMEIWLVVLMRNTVDPYVSMVRATADMQDSTSLRSPIPVKAVDFKIEDFKDLGVITSFRCADGSFWIRDESGNLKKDYSKKWGPFLKKA